MTCFLGITKTRLYNFDSLKPHFYIVKLGFTGVYIIFLIFAKKKTWISGTNTHDLCFEEKYEKCQEFFYLKIFRVFLGKIFYIHVFEQVCFCNGEIRFGQKRCTVYALNIWTAMSM